MAYNDALQGYGFSGSGGFGAITDNDRRNAIAALLLQQMMGGSDIPNYNLPADPSDPAFDAISDPTANDIVAGRGFDAMGNPAPADISAMEAAAPATAAQAAAIAAAINAGYDQGQPGYSASPSSQATNPGYNADPAAMGQINGAYGVGFMGGKGEGPNVDSNAAYDAGSLAAIAAAMGQMQGGYNTAAPSSQVATVADPTANPTSTISISNPAMNVDNPNSNYNAGLLQDAISMGFLSPGGRDVASPANPSPSTPSAFNAGPTGAPTGPGFGVGFGDTGGFTGPGYDASSTDVNAGFGTGYGNNADNYGGDISGGMGVGFGLGSDPGFGGFNDPGPSGLTGDVGLSSADVGLGIDAGEGDSGDSGDGSGGSGDGGAGK